MQVTPVWDGSQSGNATIFALSTMILVVDLREKVGIEDQQFGPGRKIAERALSSWDPDDSIYSLKKPRSSFPAALSRVLTSLFFSTCLPQFSAPVSNGSNSSIIKLGNSVVHSYQELVEPNGGHSASS